MASTADIETVLQGLQQKVEEAEDHSQLLKSQLKDCKDQLQKLNKEKEHLKLNISDIQKENETYRSNQQRLETDLYEREKEMDKLKKDITRLKKANKDVEKRLLDESQVFEKARMQWEDAEKDLLTKLRSSPSHTAARPTRRRSATTVNNMSPFKLHDIGENEENPMPESKDIFHVATKVVTGETTQRTIKTQERLILDLKDQVRQQKRAAEKQKNETVEQQSRMKQLEREIVNVKHVNQSLMEDNESYQILLHEKTISGEFMMNPIMQVEDTKRQSLRPSSSTSSNGLNLAAELNLAAMGSSDWEASQKADETNKTVQKLSEDVKQLQDTNRALQLYMNKILLKIVNNKQLEDLLSIDQPKPPVQEDTKELATSAPTSGTSLMLPTPIASLSSHLLRSTTAPGERQQRRRTISYWGKTSPVMEKPTEGSKDVEDAVDKSERRHSSIVSKTPEKSLSSGFVKALRRMSSGWGAVNIAQSVDEEEEEEEEAEDEEPLGGSTTSGEDTEKSSLEKNLMPTLSRSASSTTSSSLRASNELATLKEE